MPYARTTVAPLGPKLLCVDRDPIGLAVIDVVRHVLLSDEDLQHLPAHATHTASFEVPRQSRTKTRKSTVDSVDPSFSAAQQVGQILDRMGRQAVLCSDRGSLCVVAVACNLQTKRSANLGSKMQSTAAAHHGADH